MIAYISINRTAKRAPLKRRDADGVAFVRPLIGGWGSVSPSDYDQCLLDLTGFVLKQRWIEEEREVANLSPTSSSDRAALWVAAFVSKLTAASSISPAFACAAKRPVATGSAPPAPTCRSVTNRFPMSRNREIVTRTVLSAYMSWLAAALRAILVVVYYNCGPLIGVMAAIHAR